MRVRVCACVCVSVVVWRRVWRSKDRLVSDLLLWAPLHGPASVGRPSRTNLYSHRI